MSRNFELLQQASRADLLSAVGTFESVRPSARQQTVKAPALVARPRPREIVSEEISKLVQRLFLRGANVDGPRVVAFSGLVRDDRSSWICASAAEALAAQADTSVCLVDANFWSPQLHTHFGSDNRGGLANSLTSEAPIRDFTIPLLAKNLSLMPSGSAAGTLYAPVERWRDRFIQLREEFNYTLISAPPLTRETEATLIGQLADGIVLVVEANQTRRESVRQVKEHMRIAQISVLGAVLDQRTFPIPEFLYRKL